MKIGQDEIKFIAQLDSRFERLKIYLKEQVGLNNKHICNHELFSELSSLIKILSEKEAKREKEKFTNEVIYQEIRGSYDNLYTKMMSIEKEFKKLSKHMKEIPF